MTDEPSVDPLVQMKSLNQSQLSSVIANLLNAHPELSAEVYLYDNIFLGFGSTISCSIAGFCHAARARSRSDGGEIAVPQAEHLPLSAQHEARVQDRLPGLQPSIRTPGEPTKIPHYTHPAL